MSKLIIHVGPPKCGSSSIQKFCARKPFKGKVSYQFLPGKTVVSFNQDSISTAEFKNFIKRLNKKLKRNETVIISQEQFFPDAKSVENICNAVNTDDIKIIGYSRRQSGYLISAYNQWDFRSKDSLNYFHEILEDNNIKPHYFSGVERFLIGVICSNFNPPLESPRHKLYNWQFYYDELKKAAHNYELIADCLPSRSNPYNLIEDFCKKAGLRVKKRKRGLINKRENSQYNTGLTESIHCAFSNGINILPNEHLYNEQLELFSKLLENKKEVISEGFIKLLCDYIDSAFLQSNKVFCEAFSIPVSEFEPGRLISQEEIFEIINNEVRIRKENPENIINYYKEATGSWVNFTFHTFINQPDNKAFIKTLYMICKTNFITYLHKKRSKIKRIIKM